MTSGVEITTQSGSDISVVSTTVRSGTYALKLLPLGSVISYVDYQFSSTDSGSQFYFRFYIYIHVYPSSPNAIFKVCQASANGTNWAAMIRMSTSGVLDLEDNFNSVIGSSSALSLDTWYSVEAAVNNATTTISAQLNGSQFATSSSASTVTVSHMTIGAGIDNLVPSSGEWYFDDIAINDSTGTHQTSYPGEGQIIHLKPAAAGDNNSFTVAVGGTAGSSNNYTRVNEVTPDNATSYNGGVLNTDIDDFALDATPASIGSGDTINVVAVGMRFNAAVASAEASFKTRIKKVTGGTVSSSAAIQPTSTTWMTNAKASPHNYPLVLYNDPSGSAWTKATLNTAQAGYAISTTNTNAANISTLWVSVDSTPGTAVANTAGFMPFFYP